MLVGVFAGPFSGGTSDHLDDGKSAKEPAALEVLINATWLSMLASRDAGVWFPDYSSIDASFARPRSLSQGIIVVLRAQQTRRYCVYQHERGTGSSDDQD